MKVDIWMPIYINDYLADTMRLSAEKHGVYFLLMMDYWKHGEIPSDLEELSMIARVQPDSKSLSYIVDNFFKISGDKLKHKRIDKELKLANSRRESASQNGKKGGRPPKNNNPLETHRFNEGKPTDNPKGNPQESSSSSSSSSSLPSTPQSTDNEEGGSPPTRKRFIKPTIFELERYCKEKSYKVDCEKFINHYESNGWKVGKNKMISWKGALGSWNSNSFDKPVKVDNFKRGGINFEL